MGPVATQQFPVRRNGMGRPGFEKRRQTIFAVSQMKDRDHNVGWELYRGFS